MSDDRQKLKDIIRDPHLYLDERQFLEKSIDEMSDDKVRAWLNTGIVLKGCGGLPLDSLMEDCFKPHVLTALREADQPLTRAELVERLRQSTGITSPKSEIINKVIIRLLTFSGLKLTLK